MLFEFPTEDDWQKLVATFPFSELSIRFNDPFVFKQLNSRGGFAFVG
jgi:hypothetical protein